MPPPRNPSPGDWFLENWPAIARAAGLAVILAEMTAGFVDPSLVSAEILVAAGGLLVAPNIVGAQRSRNGKRDED